MDPYLEEVSDEDFQLAQQLDQAEQLEAFLRKNSPGSVLLEYFRDDMVQAHLALPSAVDPAVINELKIRIAAYRLLVNKLKVVIGHAENERAEMTERDRLFLARLLQPRDDQQEDA